MDKLVTSIREEQRKFQFISNENDLANWKDSKDSLIEFFTSHLTSRKTSKEFDKKKWTVLFKRCIGMYFDDLMETQKNDLHHRDFTTLHPKEKRLWLNAVVDEMKLDVKFPVLKTEKYKTLWEEWTMVMREYDLDLIEENMHICEKLPNDPVRHNGVEGRRDEVAKTLAFDNVLYKRIDAFYDFVSGYGSDTDV